MQEILYARVACAVCGLFSISTALVVSAVALTSSWWSYGPTLGMSPGDIQITLWAHVGCAESNESWTDICSMTERDCEFKEPQVMTAVTTTEAPIVILTMDPFRTTTTVTRVDFGCVSGSACAHPVTTTEDPWKNGRPPSDRGDGFNYGDETARVIEEAAVTNEKPRQKAPDTTRVRTTTTIPMVTRVIGKKPGSDTTLTPAPIEKPHSLWDEINDEYMPTGDPITTRPLATEYDPRAVNRMSTRKPGLEESTTEPGGDFFQGEMEQVAERLCYLNLTQEDNDKARKFLCGLKPQCGTMGQARTTVQVAVALLVVAGVLMLAFGGGGGGYTTPTRDKPQVEPAPTKHGLALAAAFLGALSSGLLVVSLIFASGVDVIYSLDGLGSMCAGVAVVFSFLGALATGSAGVLAKAFPGWEQTTDDAMGGKQEVDTDWAQKQLEEEYPGLKDKRQRPPPPRLAWSAPTEEPPVEIDLELEPTPTAPAVRRPQRGYHEDDDDVESARGGEALPGNSNSAILAMRPSHQAPSLMQERSLQRFFEGEGAVYAHSLFGSSSRGATTPAAPAPPATSSAVVTPQWPEGWEYTYDDEGEVYYFNRDTGDCQWEPPVSAPGTPLPMLGSTMGSLHSSRLGSTHGSVSSAASLEGAELKWKTKRSKKTGQVISVRVRQRP